MWDLFPHQRLNYWRDFRLSLGEMNLCQSLEATVKLWSYAPFVKHYLNHDLPDNWPDPWQLLHDNYYCDLAKTLGMFYTLILCDHFGQTIKDLSIETYQNTHTQEWHYIVSVNKGKYILNLIFNAIVNKKSIPDFFRLLSRHDVQSLKIKY